MTNYRFTSNCVAHLAESIYPRLCQTTPFVYRYYFVTEIEFRIYFGTRKNIPLAEICIVRDKNVVRESIYLFTDSFRSLFYSCRVLKELFIRPCLSITIRRNFPAPSKLAERSYFCAPSQEFLKIVEKRRKRGGRAVGFLLLSNFLIQGSFCRGGEGGDKPEAAYKFP